MLLKDKVVIVSGIGPGLGQELAYGAAREGAKSGEEREVHANGEGRNQVGV